MTYFDELKTIKQNYTDLFQERIDPYAIYDWWKIFTPIEKLVWQDIRFVGIPMYPQYPVDNYFIDFADPIKKIGIEVDGKEFHQDVEKDELRQKQLENRGWKIYRIKGFQTLLENKATEQVESERIVREIKQEHYYIELEED